MRVNYTFNNLLGTVYARGNVAFLDGETLLSPVGNKVTMYDLKAHRSRTLPIQAPLNITCIALSPNRVNALFVTEIGDALYVSMTTGAILHRHKFGKPVTDVQFSPDGKHIACTRDTDVHIYAAPGVFAHQYNPFLLERIYHLSNDTLTSVSWSGDSRLLLVGGGDAISRVVGGDATYMNVRVQTLGSHTARIVGAFFADVESYDTLTVDKRGILVQWTANIGGSDLVEGRFNKKLLNNEQKTGIKLLQYTKVHRTLLHDSLDTIAGGFELTSVDYNAGRQLLACGFAHGALLLHDVSDGQAVVLHSISVGQQSIASLKLNASGDWLAVAASSADTTAQLLVWEWQSETYVMREQSHSITPTCVSYSPDAQYLASGAPDAKVKLWCARSGHCLVTFAVHAAGVTAVQWTQGGKAVLSASLDGTVRAFDTKRYVNFRTLVCDRAAQLSCMCVDTAGEVVCAGAIDRYDVFVWSLTTGRLLDVLAGHTAPVSACTFNTTNALLATTSWDKTLRLWHIFDKQGTDTIQVQTDGLCCAFSPCGTHVAVLTLDSNMTVFDWEDGRQVRHIEAARHLHAGRGREDVIMAKTSDKSKSWTTMTYSPDGDYLLVGGQSARVCIFSAKHGLLLNTITITVNRSLDATTAELDWRRLRQLGAAAHVESSDDEQTSVARQTKRKALPGVKSGDRSARNTHAQVLVGQVAFAATGQSWACATTEGLLVYSHHAANQTMFNPLHLSADMTPLSTRTAVTRGDYPTALTHALALNDTALIQYVVESIPEEHVAVLCQSMSISSAVRLLECLSTAVDSTKHLHLYTIWIHDLLQRHGAALKAQSLECMHILTAIQHSLTHKHQQLARLCDQNRYMIDYVLSTTVKDE